ncbi:Re/Si-specific NAD(P)(+) transhydrogenase subunit alpha [Roseisolibacter sp. H3M3-2]|uniref:Re/Si-specific NAD(P)(+) transhydrogenase subunit alpha n=1 Tax=Roseisolibacter sp. H3M3-2 TaxID=3031323 RepID=UPI0023DAC64F|nr:Re/Si-specific NAD(P)(+) transhydrogenase subunit alpha [Roseisolibacter sp. H3M3-2]MDF1501771.1 Re/Si-specific NAD(P)(+) transhydrogenase subunit alpha [Roseisolibacter sp. H3M3-2]
MRIAVLKETADRERRVALMPDAVKRLAGAGHAVAVERGAGAGAHAGDDDYAAAGATLADDAAAAARDAQVVTKVQRPTPAEAALLPRGAVLVSLLPPAQTAELLPLLAAGGVTALALERVPRITRAQSMDVLSSQATVAGYKAVLLGAGLMPRFLPMLTTAAGNITPAKALVLGAGVAGLQAIATARRLGAVVSAFDVRAAAREQVQSLGAKFVAAELVSPGAETAGGYAREQGADEQQRTLAAIAGAIREMDLVVSTAAIPGRPAPRLITAEMVATMKPGSVIVDVSAETGGNCELTRPGETVHAHGVAILGPLNLPSTVAAHASAMFSRNVLTLLQHLADQDGALRLDLADEITGAMALTHDGQVRS